MPLIIQTSFMGGELSQNLYGMVDLAKYKSATALMRNFFADYRGGASSRFGTRYVLRGKVDGKPIRLIPFTASFNVTYVMEFGEGYIRFYTNGGPVLEASVAVTAMSGNTFTSTAVYVAGDWVFLNGNYYIVTNSASPYTVTGLLGEAVTLSGTGTVARIYTIASPYLGQDLALVKFAQNVQFMVFCHNNYPPQLLTYNGPTNWTFAPIVFGSSLSAPTIIGITLTTVVSGWYHRYFVTAVDKNGQESQAGTFTILGAPIGMTVGTQGPFSLKVTWTPVPGAVSYNVYACAQSNFPIPDGTIPGLVASTHATSYSDLGALGGTAPDFQVTPPIAKNPFVGGPLVGATITTPGAYTAVPTVTIPAPGGSGGATAKGEVVLGLQTFSFTAGPGGHSVNDVVLFEDGVALVVSSVDGTGVITGFFPLTVAGNRGAITVAGTVAPATLNDLSGTGAFATLTSCVWGVINVNMSDGGAGYTTPPVLVFDPAGAVATGTIDTPQGGPPAVPVYIQQRLALASKIATPQSIDFSQPGSPYNFDISDPIQADDAISINLVSKQLNTVKSMIPMPSGLVVLTMSSAWLINGSGGSGSPITALSIVAQSQAYNGANDMPPIVANDDVLYVQSKNSIVRDLRFNFYTSVYTGIDISVLSEHLFFGFQLKEWAWAEEPFKMVWAVRSDGQMLSLTFSKEQEIVGWAHHDTQGLFKSVCCVTETTALGDSVDATYVVVQRNINGTVVQYIERMADRYMPNGLEDAWCLDCAIAGSFVTPQTTVSGLSHLNGMVVSALADAAVVPPRTVINGSITLPIAASQVLVGLSYLPQLQTLPVEVGQPTVQSKQKRVGPTTLKVRETRGLSIGRTFGTLVDIRDAAPPILSVFPNMTFGDQWVTLDARYDDYGQVCVQQNNPWPVTVLAVIPYLEVGQ